MSASVSGNWNGLGSSANIEMLIRLDPEATNGVKPITNARNGIVYSGGSNRLCNATTDEKCMIGNSSDNHFVYYMTCPLMALCGLVGCGALPRIDLVSDNPNVTQTDESTTATPLDDTMSQFEEEVLTLVNKQRISGATCGNASSFDPTHPLVMNADLQVTARNHSLDMATRDFFDHVNPDGEDPGLRIAATGYSAVTWGENIAWGQPSPEQVVASWMSSSGHCANIMSSSFTEIGIGYDPAHIWTQVFAKPPAR
jgi:uncharacterized protein YkwD